MTERRRSRRCLCSHLVEVDGRTALLEDISAEGAAVAVEAPLGSSGGIDLLASGRRFRARVRYCLVRETDFRLGLEFDGGDRWRADLWQPEHLLN